MPVFNLKSVKCIEPQESAGDELSINFTPLDDNNLDSTHKLGGGFNSGDTRFYPSTGFPDVQFAYTGAMRIELWEDDSINPNPQDSTEIDAIFVDEDSGDGVNVVFSGPASVGGFGERPATYEISYDIL